MTLKYARNIQMRDVDIAWEEPHAATWQSGLIADQVQDLQLDGMRIDGAPGSDRPALRLNDAEGVLVRQSRIASLHVAGKSKGIRLMETDAKVTTDPGLPPVIVK
jgi:hypothetical protein